MRAFFELVPCKMSIAERLHDVFLFLPQPQRGNTQSRAVGQDCRSNPAPGKKHYVTPHTWCCVVLGFHRDDEEASAAAPIVWKGTLPAVFLWSDENIAPQLTIHSFWSIVANCNNSSIILICSSLFFSCDFTTTALESPFNKKIQSANFRTTAKRQPQGQCRVYTMNISI